MQLVEYPDSDNEANNDTTAERPTKRRRLVDDRKAKVKSELPSLPSSFKDLYPGNPRISSHDDPEMHGGRIRSVPHVRGNWSAHVYLEWCPTIDEADSLDTLVRTIEAHESDTSGPLTSLLWDNLAVPRPLHISLSAPLILPKDKKDDFLKSMLKAMEAVSRSITEPIKVQFKRFEWHANVEGTRHFLVLKLAENDQLWSLLRASNTIADKFGCQKLYHRPIPEDKDCPFHISIAWSLHKQQNTIAGSPDICEEFYNKGGDEVRSLTVGEQIVNSLHRWADRPILFDRVKIRLGQDVTTTRFRNTKE